MGFHSDACCSFITSTPPMSRIVNSKRSSQGGSRCSQPKTTLSVAPFANPAFRVDELEDYPVLVTTYEFYKQIRGHKADY
jgi:hypothetical protein